MRKFVLGFTFVSALAMTAMAAEWSGYISDAGCTTKQGVAKVAADSHAGCAKSCIKKGDKAVLVTGDGKVFKIAIQDKVFDHAGEKATPFVKFTPDNIPAGELK